jgi:hypothetical protein
MPMFNFIWSRPDKGYRLMQDDNGKDYLEEKPGSRDKLYSPLEEYPGMFFEFAEARTTKDVLNFANKYGLIFGGFFDPYGERGELRLVKHDASGIEDPDNFLFWSRNMRRIIELYKWIQTGEPQEVGDRIIWENGNVYFYTADKIPVPAFESMQEGDFYCLAGVEKPWFNNAYSDWFDGEKDGPARLIVQYNVNDRLRKAHLALASDNKDEFKPYILPISLYDALWVQLFQWITGIQKFIPCEICGRMMELTEQNRTSKRAHDSCRKNAWAKRDKDARSMVFRLLSQGKTMDEISASQNVSIDKIKKWIGGAQS